MVMIHQWLGNLRDPLKSMHYLMIPLLQLHLASSASYQTAGLRSVSCAFILFELCSFNPRIIMGCVILT
ncbi:hypothetical protein LUU34_00180700 [Aix galericulata]|nr:hypothetical protein LUU34_00180700 [Aix galericulata]